MLREQRCTREAINAEAILEAANAPPPPPGDTVINIVTIPSGHFLTEEQARAGYKWEGALIEHRPEPAPASDPIEEPPAPDEPPEYARLTLNELKKLAGVDVVD